MFRHSLGMGKKDEIAYKNLHLYRYSSNHKYAILFKLYHNTAYFTSNGGQKSLKQNIQRKIQEVIYPVAQFLHLPYLSYLYSMLEKCQITILYPWRKQVLSAYISKVCAVWCHYIQLKWAIHMVLVGHATAFFRNLAHTPKRRYLDAVQKMPSYRFGLLLTLVLLFICLCWYCYR